MVGGMLDPVSKRDGGALESNLGFALLSFLVSFSIQRVS